MRLSSAVTTCLWLASVPGSAFAADWYTPTLEQYNDTRFYSAPTWSVVGSLSPTWTNNALFSESDRRADTYFEPDMTLRLDGNLTPDVSYRLYGRTEFAAFSRVDEAEAAFALWGARLSRDIAGWNASIIYENRYEFAGIYQERLFTAHDIKAAISRDFIANNVILTPFIQGRYRISDLAETWDYRLDLVLGIEVELNERWSIVSTPFFEAYWFEDGLNAGRRDQIYSASLGLKYNIADNVSLTTSIAFEERKSNAPERDYRNIDIGPRLDFRF